MSSSFQLRSHPDRFLAEHLFSVAEACRSLVPSQGFTTELDASEVQRMTYVVGASHDVGKATRYFQEYVISRRTVSPLLKSHSLLSSLYAYYAAREGEFKLGPLIPVYAQLTVLGHHGALRSPTSAAAKLFDAQRRGLLRDQLKAIQHIDELEEALAKMRMPSFSEFAEKSDRLTVDLAKSVAVLSREHQRAFNDLLVPFFAVNLSLSALVDADRMDAARLTFPARGTVRARDVEDYVAHLSEEVKKSRDVDLNVANGRNLLFGILTEKASGLSLGRRVLSLTAPTGYGKTLAGLHFALKLKERLLSQGLKPRVIYVAPFLSILDQNFEVIRKCLNIAPGQSNLLLIHHHLAEMNYQPISETDESFSTLDSELLIEGWNSEIIVTTFIQFFYSMLGIRASQLRRFHNLEGSIVLLDEVQSIPHEYWGLVRDVILFLSERFRMYVILMTATQPLIFEPGQIDELVETFPSKLQKTRVNLRIKICPELPIDAFSEEVRNLIASNPQNSTLIVLNSIRSATEVYRTMDTSEEKYYLSANLVPRQRSERLDAIVSALRGRRPITLVSTQVVEAGVDLDFDMAIRDIGPIDSIIQVAGRCNRSGSRDPAHSPVYVYAIIDSKGREVGQQIYGNYLIEKSREVLADAGTDVDLSRLSSAYYKRVRAGASELESNQLLSSMRRLDYQGLDSFRLIDDQDSASVYIELNQEAEDTWQTYEKLTDVFKGLRAKEEFLRIRQLFYSYVVNVPERALGGLREVKGFYRVPRSNLDEFYDYQTGFKR